MCLFHIWMISPRNLTEGKCVMANYAILRMEKRKLAAVGRIGKHNERLKKEYKSNPDIDPERTNLNYHIIEPRDVYRKAVLDRIEEVGAKRRKDSVVMQDCFIGVTPEWIRAKPSEEKTGFSPWIVVTALRGCVAGRTGNDFLSPL